MGKLIVFEGIDGSGKSTQSNLLRERLRQEGVPFRSVTFPRYDNPSATLIKMYLGGEFGTRPGDVNAYAASTFFAVDRFASFRQDWQSYYDEGGLLILDRYTTSNAIHQGAKLSKEQRSEFFRWLYDFEFNLIGIPRPDAVLYMDIDLSVAEQRILSREAATGVAADIHEKDLSYLGLCHDCGRQAAAELGWYAVTVATEEKQRSIEEIHEEIYRICKEIIND